MAPGQPVEAGRVPEVSRSQTGRLEREDESTKRDCGTISGESLQRAKALSGGRKLAKVVPGGAACESPVGYGAHKNRLWGNSGSVEKLNLCGLARWRDYRANEAGFGVVSAAGDTSG